jgi:putative NADPH-quinone reductase
MPNRIAIVDGHPDPDPARFVHALAEAYARGAREGGTEVRVVRVADLDVPVLRRQEEWNGGPTPPAVAEAQGAIAWADHLVILYPLWLGSMPALLKAFFEQVFRPGFALPRKGRSLRGGLLKGKSARVVVTMGMPGFVYRWFYLGHSVKALERNILSFVGLGPVKTTLIGSVGNLSESRRTAWLDALEELGRTGG